MGSLTLALAGGIGGAGAGITEVAQQAQKQQLLERESDLAAARDATHERLRANLEAQNQQATDVRRETYETGAKQKEYEVMQKSAAAHAEFAKTLKTLEIQGRHQDIADLVAGRVTVQQLKNQQAAANAAGKPANSLFKSGGMLTLPGGKDKLGSQLPSKKLPMILGPGGVRLVKVPGSDDPDDPNAAKYAPLGANGELPSVTGLSRAPQADIQDASDNPDRVGAFFNKYGFVTQGHVANGLRPAPQSSPGMPRGLPKGSTYTPPPDTNTSAAGSSANNDSQDALDERDDNYALGGDRGLQPEDFQPAQ